MKNYLDFIRKTNNSGFTLIELILASVGMFFVVMAAGYGILVIARENVAANAAGDIQYNLGRAVDFISEEVKTASLIRDNVSSANLTANAANFTQAADKTVILAIRVPGISQDIIYYTKPPSDPWLGNLAIYRWGPPLDSNGAYTNATTPANWTEGVLVDLIADAPLTTGCANGATTGWTQIPSTTSTTPKGFYVCANNTTGTSNGRKSVEIRASASALDTQKTTGLQSATVANSRFYDKATYEIITQAYARAN